MEPRWLPLPAAVFVCGQLPANCRVKVYLLSSVGANAKSMMIRKVVGPWIAGKQEQESQSAIAKRCSVRRVCTLIRRIPLVVVGAISDSRAKDAPKISWSVSEWTIAFTCRTRIARARVVASVAVWQPEAHKRKPQLRQNGGARETATASLEVEEDRQPQRAPPDQRVCTAAVSC